MLRSARAGLVILSYAYRIPHAPVSRRSNVMPARSTSRGIMVAPSAAAGVQIPPGVSVQSLIKQSAASAMIFDVEP